MQYPCHQNIMRTNYHKHYSSKEVQRTENTVQANFMFHLNQRKTQKSSELQKHKLSDILKTQVVIMTLETLVITIISKQETWGGQDGSAGKGISCQARPKFELTTKSCPMTSTYVHEHTNKCNKKFRDLIYRYYMTFLKEMYKLSKHSQQERNMARNGTHPLRGSFVPSRQKLQVGK